MKKDLGVIMQSFLVKLNLKRHNIQRQLLKRNLLPKFFLKKKPLTTLLNLFRCQAHRDVAVETIKQAFED